MMTKSAAMDSGEALSAPILFLMTKEDLEDWL
jgi:hypothetical protein